MLFAMLTTPSSFPWRLLTTLQDTLLMAIFEYNLKMQYHKDLHLLCLLPFVDSVMDSSAVQSNELPFSRVELNKQMHGAPVASSLASPVRTGHVKRLCSIETAAAHRVI